MAFSITIMERRYNFFFLYTQKKFRKDLALFNVKQNNKLKLNIKNKGGIYFITCNCPREYIGEPSIKILQGLKRREVFYKTIQ